MQQNSRNWYAFIKRHCHGQPVKAWFACWLSAYNLQLFLKTELSIKQTVAIEWWNAKISKDSVVELAKTQV